jgi:hypothetical protein
LYLAAETNIRLIGVGEYPLLHCCCCFDAVPLLGTFHGRPRRTLPDSAKKIVTKSGDIPHQTNRISRIVLLHIAIRAGGFAPEASIAKKNSPYGTGAGKETIFWLYPNPAKRKSRSRDDNLNRSAQSQRK